MNQKVKIPGDAQTSTSSASFSFVTSATTAPNFKIERVTSKPRTNDLEMRVLKHIQALRGLGYATVNTAEVARALGVAVADVDGTIAALQARGVRVAP